MSTRPPAADPAAVVAAGDGCAPAAPALLDRHEAERVAAAFKALADPTRVRLLAHVAAAPDGTVCACHLPDALGISQPTLSHHMKRLTEAGLVAREQRGRWAHYSLLPGGLEHLRAFLDPLGSVAAS